MEPLKSGIISSANVAFAQSFWLHLGWRRLENFPKVNRHTRPLSSTAPLNYGVALLLAFVETPP
jgi:hypothetical protein